MSYPLAAVDLGLGGIPARLPFRNLWKINIIVENHHFSWENPINSHSGIALPRLSRFLPGVSCD